jgi:hypothetical protein
VREAGECNYNPVKGQVWEKKVREGGGKGDIYQKPLLLLEAQLPLLSQLTQA